MQRAEGARRRPRQGLQGPEIQQAGFPRRIFLVSQADEDAAHRRPGRGRAAYRGPASPRAIFAEYPKLLKDSTLIHLICDTLRLVVVSSGTLDPHAVEEVMDNAIKTHHHHAIAPANTLQTLADALPALGIVAAVLGVVKTMGSIDKPPAILGEMIGSALVGTFLGVLLAYGIVGPFANRAKQVIEADARDLSRRQADHHRLAPRPSAAAGDRGGALGHRPCEPAGLRRRVRRHAGTLRPWLRRQPRRGRERARSRRRSSSRRSSWRPMAAIMAAPGRSPMPTS